MRARGWTKLGAGLVAIGLLAQPAIAQQAGDMGLGKQAGTWLIRGRAVAVAPDVSSSISVIGGKAAVTTSGSPEVDVTYFLTDNIAAELIAATTRHGVKATGTSLGTVNLGSTWVLPPTATLQWHFAPKAQFSPYVGAGLNVTFFYNGKVPGGLIQKVTYSNNASAALQAGVDIGLGGRWFLNADVKKIFLSTTAKVNGGAIVAKVDLDPWVGGIGFGYRF